MIKILHIKISGIEQKYYIQKNFILKNMNYKKKKKSDPSVQLNKLKS